MHALVKEAPGVGMTYTEVPDPTPDPEEVLLEVEAVGIDGGVEAKIYYWEDDRFADRLPHIFGHEFAGRVVECGDAVDSVAVGERVAVEPGITCGRCINCRAGEPNICLDRQIHGVDTGEGALAEYVTVPATNVYPLPDGMDADTGAYLEVFALAVNALEYSQFGPGDSVGITGPGSVGFGVLVAAREAGAGPITMIGADADTGDRLPIAAEMGASEVINIEEESIDREFDVFFEASGAVPALDAAIEHVRPGGEIVQIGLFHGHEKVPARLNRLTQRGVGYRPIRARRDSSWRRAIELAKRVDFQPILTPTFDLADHEAAFEAEKNRAGVNVLLHP